ncbi:MAG TPA: DUF3006 domain-containing protein [Pyrinomonadaceae bacterium]|jgi:hypothetical protein|nr:DUF3006 domain-containing protein [Pyrinomonadaceae bacterium]
MTKRDEDADKGARKGEKKGAREDRAESVELRAVVDRVEGGETAVLSLEGHKSTLDVPLAHLPEGASDGDHLRLTFDGEPSARTLTKASLDRTARASAEDRVKRMQERLEKLGGAEGKKDFKL